MSTKPTTIPDDYGLTLTMHAREVNTILLALGALPYNNVAGLINKLQGQCESQIALIMAQQIPSPEDKLGSGT